MSNNADLPTYKPDWQPKNAGSEYACFVMNGVEGTGAPSAASAQPRRAKLSTDDYIEGITGGDRMILARAITLIESNAPKHFEAGQELIQRILPYTGKSMRMGITGVPGAGKSTFIEALGTWLCSQGHKVAVLAVDPSSTVTKGSILGDKTRMEQLARNPNAFIRPSPSGGTLGGVSRKSRETLLLVEAAGYDVVLVETVGVGQSETTVRSMVDYFLLIALTGAGDDLQGIKKGIMELADSILVNKADGDNKLRAQTARADFDQMLHYLRPATEGWTSRAYTCSSLTGEGIPEMWSVAESFFHTVKASGVFEKRRQEQTLGWVGSMADEYLKMYAERNEKLAEIRRRIESDVVRGNLSPTLAAKQIIDAMERILFRGTA
ncbi:MAG: methylmalonyl Co-A mutase-associated GTPase MeaB [Pyramidobacter sp.]|nr:methylmalonyl Co-A mutase-associated GTPase MeaB [Pyramidobacter sp.]